MNHQPANSKPNAAAHGASSRSGLGVGHGVDGAKATDDPNVAGAEGGRGRGGAREQAGGIAASAVSFDATAETWALPHDATIGAYFSSVVDYHEPCDTTMPTPYEAPDETAERLPIGSVHELDSRYEILGHLGAGSMGQVYLARQWPAGREVALKFLRPGFLEQQEFVDRFLAEATVAAGLEHPNLAPIYDVGRTAEGTPFYSMKVIRGTPWSERLGRMSLRENIDILLTICDALIYAHSQNVIHRDIKPANVMLGSYGEVHLVDWGLAVAAPGGPSKAFPASQCPPLAGTPCFMAPEMAKRELDRIGVASDVYLLGGILFQLLTGRPPHGGSSARDCLRNARRNAVDFPVEAGQLLSVARRALATEPEARYSSTAAFRDAVRDYFGFEESLHLCARAEHMLQRAERRGDTERFLQAIALYQQALSQWRENETALAGQRRALEAYARFVETSSGERLAAHLRRLAIKKGDAGE